jgi:hypothetical protein
MIMVSISGCIGKKKIAELYDHQKEIDAAPISEIHMEHLPKPVKRYFEVALGNAGMKQKRLLSMKIEYHGKFRTDLSKPFDSIKGVQHFTANKPGFVWIGKTAKFTAVDSYIDGKGRLKVYLFSMIPIAHFKGEKIDQAELLRWLGESVWMPTNLLPGEYISWEAVDDNSAFLKMDYRDMSVKYLVTFTKSQGLIEKIETQRYKDDELVKWVGQFGNYTWIDGMIIPTRIMANWRIDGELKPYADFHVKSFNYEYH